MAEYTHPDDLGDVVRAFEIARSSGLPYEGKVRRRKHNGEYHWFLQNLHPVHDEHGQIVRWCGARIEIHDDKIKEEDPSGEYLALRDELDRVSMFEEIVGTSPALKAALDRIAKVRATDSTVLITGETGTGKELVARAIHKRSSRASVRSSV